MSTLVLLLIAAPAIWAGSQYLRPFGRCPRCQERRPYRARPAAPPRVPALQGDTGGCSAAALAPSTVSPARSVTGGGPPPDASTRRIGMRGTWHATHGGGGHRNGRIRGRGRRPGGPRRRAGPRFADGGRGSRGRSCRRPGGPAHLAVAPLAGGPRRGSAPRSRGSSTPRRGGPPSRPHSLRPRSSGTCITTGTASAPPRSPLSPGGAARPDEPSHRPRLVTRRGGPPMSPATPVTGHATAGATGQRPAAAGIVYVLLIVVAAGIGAAWAGRVVDDTIPAPTGLTHSWPESSESPAALQVAGLPGPRGESPPTPFEG
jgi:hypothetical protein